MPALITSDNLTSPVLLVPYWIAALAAPDTPAAIKGSVWISKIIVR